MLQDMYSEVNPHSFKTVPMAQFDFPFGSTTEKYSKTAEMKYGDYKFL